MTLTRISVMSATGETLMTPFLDYLGTVSELKGMNHEHDCAAADDAGRAECGSLDVWKRYKYPRFLSLA
jgi:hypothetical protein